MGENSAISWCHDTKNLWWGCWKIAPECANCYADTLARRHAPGHWGRTAPRRFFKPGHLGELLKWNRKAERAGERRRVFVGSMMDWAERHPVPEIAARQNAERRVFWPIARQCTSLDFLMLTKRPEDARNLLPWMASPEDWASVGVEQAATEQIAEPWLNVWLGVSAGHLDSLDKIQTLRTIPAAVRFVSCEPILSDITAEEWDVALGGGAIHWLIVGDESGHGARPAKVEWVRTARDAAARNGVAFHFKQWAGADAEGIEGREAPRKKIHLPVLDGRQWAEFPGAALEAVGKELSNA